MSWLLAAVLAIALAAAVALLLHEPTPQRAPFVRLDQPAMVAPNAEYVPLDTWLCCIGSRHLTVADGY